MKLVQPIVEGHGDVAAVPVLLRRFLADAQCFGLQVARPVRQPKGKLVREDGLRKAVRLALKKADCAAIIVLFDADDDCPKELAPTLRQWACDEAGPVPCEIVVAMREYEAWFLASLPSLELGEGIAPHDSPETIRDAKGKLESYMGGGSYMETIDQAKLTARLDFASACECRSFHQAVKAFVKLARATGCAMKTWPPTSWGIVV